MAGVVLDLDRIRAETPGILAHPESAYLHNAGAALMPRIVLDAQKNHLDLEAEIGGYAAAAREAARLGAVYDSVARLLNAARDEVALVENATVAWQMAFYGLALTFRPGDRILTAQAEYGANYVAMLQAARRSGALIEIIPNAPSGEIDVGALAAMIDGRVKLIAVTWVPTNGGLANPAAAIGRVARAHDIPYLLDACQAVGQMVTDVAALGCDMLSATGRKFLRGPRGSGFLYVRRSFLDRLEPPMIDHHAAPWVARDRYQLRADARRFENWENNYAAQTGLGAAIDYALAIGLDLIEARCKSLARRLREGLGAIAGVKLRDLGNDPSAIVSFSHERIPAHEIVATAGRAGITIGSSDPDTTRLDAEARSLPVLVRASPHYYNSEAEVDRLVDCIATL
ncbi:selenocysteine lyase/cysteine desulfurase [Dongia mobilis]|uniref:Selenocysteine lyase/cysteine desulfurase n=1 Tax=Dongia mobilis TaxID=578943 RepID=A0A4R6WPN4_9PROT|nr:aminotransferase class V-fold PLP-dependent enzyme [Dongia mobilis]TDQ83065.1 selenocysteine lyase/cysteine desulfurase [Dongia mobilis]